MCWNRGVPLYTEVSSFQGVEIEEFHCIQKCPHLNRGILLCTEVSSFHNRVVSLYTEVFSFQGVRIEGFHCMQTHPWVINRGVSMH